MAMTNTPNLRQTILEYRKAGLSIIPTSGEKVPVVSWKQFQERIATEQEVEPWLSNFEHFGVVCGKVSGHLELIDFDNRAGRDIALIFQYWRGMLDEQAPGLFERLLIARSQSGGFHVPYRCPETKIPGNMKLAEFKTGDKILTLIETRGEGGQFLVYPSPGYRVMAGDFCSVPVVTARERAFMLGAARSFNECVEPSRVVNGPRKTRPKGTGLSPGDDFNKRGDLPALLSKHGWSPVKGNAHFEHWRRPGKETGGHSASIIEGRILFVFSSNAHPFEPGTSYSVFAVYTYLEHGGDYSKAARELAHQGYGETRACHDDGETTATIAFPASVMSGVAGDFAQLYAKHLESPPHFFYFAFLTCLGLFLADKLTLASEIAPQPRLYVLLLGESADERKSTVLNKVVDFFRHSLEGFPVCWGIGSAEGLQKRLAQGNRLLLCFDEVKQFISKCKIEGSVLLPCVNTLFESNHYENRTKTTDIYLEKVYLAMLGASTVATYENTWSSQFTDIGFGNRLFLVPGSGERRFSLPAKIPEPERNHLKQRLGQILRHVAERLEFSLTRPAWEVYDQWYLGLEKSVHIRESFMTP
jgi:hypothetical protein